MSKSRVAIIAELKDHITGPATKAKNSMGDLGGTAEKAGKHAAQAWERTGRAAEDGARRTQSAGSRLERVFKELDGSASRMSREFRTGWDEAERGPARLVRALESSGAQMVAESQQIGRRVGSNIRDGVQGAIDSIDVSGITAALGGLTVGGGVLGALEQDKLSRQAAASTGANPAAIRDLVGVAYALGLGDDYASATAAGVSVVGTLALEPGSPEAEKMLRGTLTAEEAFGVDPQQWTLATRITAEVDGVSFAQAQDMIGAAIQGAAPGSRDELMDALLEYGPLLGGTGIDSSVLANVLSQASVNGPMAVDKTGDAFKEFAIRTTTGDKAAMDAYSALGLSGDDVSARLLEGDPAVFTDVNRRLAAVTDPTQQARFAVALYGTPMEDLGVGQIDKHLEQWSALDLAVQDTTGTMSSLEEILTSGYEADSETMLRALAGAMTAVGDAAAPILTPVFRLVEAFAKPIAAGVTGVTVWGVLQRIPGGAAAAKWALSGLWRVASATPLGRLVTIVGLVLGGLGQLYDRVKWVRDGFDWFSDSVSGAYGWLDDLGGKIDELVQEKFPALHDALDLTADGSIIGKAAEGLNMAGDAVAGKTGIREWLGTGEHWGSGEGLLRFLHGSDSHDEDGNPVGAGDVPAHAAGGWTSGGAHLAMVGEQGPEYVVNAWASRKVEATHPGALDQLNQGRLPVAPVAVAGAGEGFHYSPIVVVQGAGHNAEEIRAVVRGELDQQRRQLALTYGTPTLRGAR